MRVQLTGSIVASDHNFSQVESEIQLKGDSR